jgi:hypothetical protein
VPEGSDLLLHVFSHSLDAWGRRKETASGGAAEIVSPVSPPTLIHYDDPTFSSLQARNGPGMGPEAASTQYAPSRGVRRFYRDCAARIDGELNGHRPGADALVV